MEMGGRLERRGNRRMEGEQEGRREGWGKEGIYKHGGRQREMEKTCCISSSRLNSPWVYN